MSKKHWTQSTGQVDALDRVAGYVLSAFCELTFARLQSGPLVSVVIATYNRSSNLRLAIDSVLSQAYQTFEILVIGDGCTDDSEAVVKSFADPRVRWHALRENSGSQSLPNNLGLKIATGKYVAYLGHDDVWLPSHLSALVRAMERKRLDAATTRCFSIGPPATNALALSGPGLLPTQRITVPPSALCHRRDILEKSGEWTNYKELSAHYFPDIEFVDRLNLASSRSKALRRVGVVKLNAAWRKNFYQWEDASEQAYWLGRSKKPRRLVLSLLAKAVWLQILNPRVTLPIDDVKLEPGEHIVDAFKRVKGLSKR